MRPPKRGQMPIDTEKLITWEVDLEREKSLVETTQTKHKQNSMPNTNMNIESIELDKTLQECLIKLECKRRNYFWGLVWFRLTNLDNTDNQANSERVVQTPKCCPMPISISPWSLLKGINCDFLHPNLERKNKAHEIQPKLSC